jgi:hypothetical protein
MSVAATSGVLIGGGGQDSIFDHNQSNDSIVIGGNTSYNTNLTAIVAILADWTKSGATFIDRVTTLKTGTTAGLYTLQSKLTVFDDGFADSLGGLAGTDWFFARVGQDTTDVEPGDETIQFMNL